MAIIEKPILGDAAARRRGEVTAHLLAAVPRYSRFVRISKFSLGVLSFLLILLVVVIPILSADEEGLRLAFNAAQESKQESLPMMTNPTFQGVDQDNQPYVVTADSAIQHDGDTIILNNVQGDMLTSGDTWISVRAKQGAINNVAKTMRLNEDVRLMHQNGMEFRTESVDIDMVSSRFLDSGQWVKSGQTALRCLMISVSYALKEMCR